MRTEAEKRGLSVRVSSMGLLPGGLPMPERGVAAATEFHLDLRHHRSSAIQLNRLEDADLVLGMARHHIREVVSARPALWPRAFTLKQFARFAAGRTKPRRAQLASWIEAEAGDRPRGEMLGHTAEDDIADPLRASSAVWRTVIKDIQTNVVRILEECAPLLQPAIPASRR